MEVTTNIWDKNREPRDQRKQTITMERKNNWTSNVLIKGDKIFLRSWNIINKHTIEELPVNFKELVNSKCFIKINDSSISFKLIKIISYTIIHSWNQIKKIKTSITMVYKNHLRGCNFTVSSTKVTSCSIKIHSFTMVHNSSNCLLAEVYQL